MQQFDILVVGSGLVGAAFVRAIATTNARVLVIDKLPFRAAYQPDLDNRGLAISYTSKKILSELQVWQDLFGLAYPITSVHVSEQNSFGFTKISANQYNLPALGYILSASNLNHCLADDLEKLSNVTVLRPCTIKQTFYDAHLAQWLIDLDTQQIQAKLIIAAEGSNSQFGTKISELIVRDYQQTAIVTNVFTEQKNISTAYERFIANGVLALLPFGEQRLKCVWTVNNSDLQRINALHDEEFIIQLQNAFGWRCGKFTGISERQTFPLRSTHINQLYGTNLVLLGNAANTLHPVAAQGFNMGLRDAATLARMLQTVNFTEAKINFTLLLQKYASLRSIDHAKTREFTNLLLRIFATDLPLAKFARGCGLVAAHLLPAMNRKFLQQGLGAWQ